MKLVVAIIRPEQFAEVERTLHMIGFEQMTHAEVWGQGHERGMKTIYRGTAFQQRHLNRIKLELVVADEAVRSVVEVIENTARTGHRGDGVILVSSLDDVIHIRTGQCSERIESPFANPMGPAPIPRVGARGLHRD